MTEFLEETKIIKVIEKKHGIKLLKLFTKVKNECNQCHANCNDCGWDR